MLIISMQRQGVLSECACRRASNKKIFVIPSHIRLAGYVEDAGVPWMEGPCGALITRSHLINGFVSGHDLSVSQSKARVAGERWLRSRAERP